MSISEESARPQLEIFLDYYDMEKDDDTEDLIEKILKAIMKGRLQIEDKDGLKVTQILKKKVGEKSEIEYGVLTGKQSLEMQKQKGEYSRIYGMLASLSNTSVSTFSKMERPDLKVSEALGMLFLLG